MSSNMILMGAIAAILNNDPHWEKVIFQARFNEETTGTWKDDRGHLISGSGPLAAAIGMFGTRSLYLNKGYLTTPFQYPDDFQDKDFTCEFFFNPISAPANTCGIFQYKYGTQVGFEFRLFNNRSVRVQVRIGSQQINATIPALTLGVWYHMAVTRQGNSLKIWCNGVLISTMDCTGVNWNNTRIDMGQAGTAASCEGYLDEVRLTKGIARYTAPFNHLTDTYFV